MSEIVNYDRQGAVAVVTMNSPDGMNLLTTQLSVRLHQVLEQVKNDNSVRVVVLTGAGRCFSGGADLKGGFDGESAQVKLQNDYRPILSTVATMPMPVIAAVKGSAAGVGMSLALHCDLMIMADDAFLLSPFATISLLPDGGLNWLLVRQLGYRRAFQLCVESERIAAQRCVELGLANKAVPADELLGAAVEWAESLSKRAPLSLAATKKAMRYAMDHDWASTYDTEAQLQDALFQSKDCAEGIAAFLEKRPPEFKGE